MIKVTDNMKKQWNKWMSNLFEYLPTRYEATPRDWEVRRFIWDFKDGNRSLGAAKVVADRLIKQFGEGIKQMTFVCIPASSAEKNEKRYHQFSEEVCRLTGAANAFDAITVSGSRLAIHETKRGAKQVYDAEVIEFDEQFFNGRQVIVFDDIITRGYSYARFACKLESFGASVIGGLFLAKTINF